MLKGVCQVSTCVFSRRKYVFSWIDPESCTDGVFAHRMYVTSLHRCKSACSCPLLSFSPIASKLCPWTRRMICSSCLLVFFPQIVCDLVRWIAGMLIVSPYTFSYRQYAIWSYRCKNVPSTCLFMCLPAESMSCSHIDTECCADVVSCFCHLQFVRVLLDRCRKVSWLCLLVSCFAHRRYVILLHRRMTCVLILSSYVSVHSSYAVTLSARCIIVCSSHLLFSPTDCMSLRKIHTEWSAYGVSWSVFFLRGYGLLLHWYRNMCWWCLLALSAKRK